ncbi:MAG: TonB-dependent receptor, partial [Bacteroidota bacterium]
EEVQVLPKIDQLETISKIDLSNSTVRSSQDVLQRVPGLFIGQHAGGGKAEQIFLRGFDIDHGTDLLITVDGMPVNMVSHSHGQGYADLHFVIPETIEGIQFGKGSYDAEKGNFATAGHVNYQLQSKLDKGLVKVEAGMFNHRRIVAMSPIISKERTNLYLASEYRMFDGPFEFEQNFQRFNVLARLQHQTASGSIWRFTASHFTSDWYASGQIPVRAVENGLIDRFGAIDPTEGGQTSRSNVQVHHLVSPTPKTVLSSQVYATDYRFRLHSNFTFFLNDSINGDRIRQKERRQLIGGQSEFKWGFDGNWSGELKAGISFRYDRSNDNELAEMFNRTDLKTAIQRGDVEESNYAGYTQLFISKGKFSFVPGLRFDLFRFGYRDQLTEPSIFQDEYVSQLSPKLNVTFQASKNTQIYLKTGSGFHSNDSRLVLQQEVSNSLPASVNGDLGLSLKPTKNMFISVAVWTLFLEQEFVYVGDAGIVEPSGKTFRRGIDFSLRYQVKDWIRLQSDVNYTLANSVDEPEGEDYIPLAPDFTMLHTLWLGKENQLNGMVQFRHLGDRAANEDNSIVANGYSIVDVSVNYPLKRWTLGLDVQNVLDTEWEEAQFATESRLSSENESVEEIH